MQRVRSKRHVPHTSESDPAGNAGDSTERISRAACPAHAIGEEKPVEYHPGLSAMVAMTVMDVQIGCEK